MVLGLAVFTDTIFITKANSVNFGCSIEVLATEVMEKNCSIACLNHYCGFCRFCGVRRFADVWDTQQRDG